MEPRSARAGRSLPSDDVGDAEVSGQALVARELRLHRERAGLSRSQLATRVGYSRSYISTCEKPGSTLISEAVVRRIDHELDAGGVLVALHARADSDRKARQARARVIAEPPDVPAANAIVDAVLEPRAPLPASGYRYDRLGRPGRTADMAAATSPAQLIAMSTHRAREFLNEAERVDVGIETIEQLADDIRRLAVAYPQQPLETLLPDIARAQQSAFTLLEGQPRPSQGVDIYLLAGVASGLMARAAHDVGTSHDAMTQARAVYVCADNAGHDGLRGWARGLQSLIAYWAENLAESVRYAEHGRFAVGSSRGSASVWVAANHARALAASGHAADAEIAITTASSLRESVESDELDELGGLCSFSRPRQLYYSAEALAWCGADQAAEAERIALEALEAYEAAPPGVRAFGDEAGTRCALAMARIKVGTLEGADAALRPVLELPQPQRTYGVVTAVERVGHALTRDVSGTSNSAVALMDEIRSFRSHRLALPA
jgi:transcriptional regulator with XRE-family HTH domain